MAKRTERAATALGSALVILSGCALLPGDDPADEAHATVTGVRAALHGAGSATVEFNVRLGPQYSRNGAHWAGTTRSRYGDEPASETEYRSFSVRSVTDPTNPGHTRPIDLHVVTEGTLRHESVRYHRSEDFQAPEDRPWVRLEPGEGLTYGPDIANPDLGVVDPEWYLELLASLPRHTAYSTVTDRREEVDGISTDVHHLSCWLPSEECPYPGEDDPVLRLFPEHNRINLTFWLDDDGRPRQLEAETTFQFESSSGGPDGSTLVVYTATATMTFGGFGEPVEVAAPPPADQISQWPPAG